MFMIKDVEGFLLRMGMTLPECEIWLEQNGLSAQSARDLLAGRSVPGEPSGEMLAGMALYGLTKPAEFITKHLVERVRVPGLRPIQEGPRRAPERKGDDDFLPHLLSPGLVPQAPSSGSPAVSSGKAKERAAGDYDFVPRLVSIGPTSSAVDRDGDEPALRVAIAPGRASRAELAELFYELSKLYRMVGGSGIEFVYDRSVPVSDLVEA